MGIKPTSLTFYAPKNKLLQAPMQGQRVKIACRSVTYHCVFDKVPFYRSIGLVFREAVVGFIKDGQYVLTINVTTPHSDCPKVPCNMVDMDTICKEPLNSREEVWLPLEYIWAIL